MIYGDTVQKLNVTVDAEGGEHFTAIPQLLAIRQAGNLYGYAANDPISFVDYSGENAIAVYFDQNRDLTLRMGSVLLGAAISAMLIDKLTDDDPPILYAKKGTKGTSHPNSAVAMGGSSPASPPPNRNQNRRDYFLNKAKNSKLKSIIDQLYRKDAKIGDGGTADMLRYEYTSGRPLNHLQKATDRIVQLTRLLYLEQLVDSDIKLVYQLLDDLYDAVKYVGGGK